RSISSGSPRTRPPTSNTTSKTANAFALPAGWSIRPATSATTRPHATRNDAFSRPREIGEISQDHTGGSRIFGRNCAGLLLVRGDRAGADRAQARGHRCATGGTRILGPETAAGTTGSVEI